MPNSFSAPVFINKQAILAVIVPQLRKDGMYYEVNIKGYLRFYMKWSELGRYDAVGDEAPSVPYEVVLAVSDMIEQHVGRR